MSNNIASQSERYSSSKYAAYISSLMQSSASPTTPIQTAQGAAIEGVYHPPVLPWEGHNEDVLFTSDVAVEHSSMWPSEKAVIWALIAISLGLSIAALIS